MKKKNVSSQITTTKKKKKLSTKAVKVSISVKISDGTHRIKGYKV